MLTVYTNPRDFLDELDRRRTGFYPEVEARVRELLAQLRAGGDDFLYETIARYDGVDLRGRGLEVPPPDWAAAEAGLDPELRAALQRAADNIRAFHLPQVPQSWQEQRPDGTVVGQVVTAMDRVGVYVPGGQAPLFSCLLMTAIPARVAGVREIVLCTPPDREGNLHPAMLATARLAGVDRVFRVGGPAAIGAMAYGTASIPRVDKIAGPGSMRVTMAKRLVFGPVGIDMLAGPTELGLVDDGTLPAAWVAADLLSQAEHDGGMVVLITLSAQRAAAVNAELAQQVPRLPGAAGLARNLGTLGGALVAGSLAEAVELANAVAPEHLELAVQDPVSLLPGVRHAGSIFMGPWTPEPMGDYIAGPSNVIPTEGTPRYASPVNVETFLKRSAIVRYSEAAFRAEGPLAVAMALSEGLPVHAHSMQVRLGKL